MQVKDIIGKCDTGLARPLNLALINKLNRLTKTPLLVEVKHPLIDTSASSVNPFLQPAAAKALIKAVEQQRQKLIINSCLRTTIQQHIIRRQFERGLCGITAAALPGRSNHEDGAAIDIGDANNWQVSFEIVGWKRLGLWDFPHYDFYGERSDISKLQISAVQMYWNENNPKDLLVVDGGYGEETAKRIDLMPISGY
jgi:N-acetylmuramoyl-L-alanine amidase